MMKSDLSMLMVWSCTSCSQVQGAGCGTEMADRLLWLRWTPKEEAAFLTAFKVHVHEQHWIILCTRFDGRRFGKL